MRYLIKYTKEGELKFLAHLDLMRSMQKVIRRADLPAAYSQGFNPHMILSIAQPLSVGMASEGDYMDVVFTEKLDEKELVKTLNQNSTINIRFLDAAFVDETEKKAPQSMALIDAAKYTMKLKALDAEKALNEIEELLKEKSWVITKKNKKGQLKEQEIRNLIYDIKYWVKDEEVVINVLVACGSKENLSANVLAEYIKDKCIAVNKEAFTQIKREEMYAYKGKKLVPLCEYFR